HHGFISRADANAVVASQPVSIPDGGPNSCDECFRFGYLQIDLLLRLVAFDDVCQQEVVAAVAGDEACTPESTIGTGREIYCDEQDRHQVLLLQCILELLTLDHAARPRWDQ